MDGKKFELEEQEEDKLYALILMAIFKSIHKENLITENEYKTIKNMLKRTFNIQQSI